MVSLQQNLRNVEQFEWPLFAGTLRRNLDPFSQNDDVTLNDALWASGLFSLQADRDEARLTLDSDIASGGNNLSVGQRQIIALARAIVRNSKFLILDEGEQFVVSKSLRWLTPLFFVVATSTIGTTSYSQEGSRKVKIHYVL